MCLEEKKRHESINAKSFRGLEVYKERDGIKHTFMNITEIEYRTLQREL